MKLSERFENVNDDYLKFDQIEKPLHPSNDLAGLLKIASLLKDPTNFPMSADHDSLYLARPEDMVELTDDDILELTRCGISYDSSNDCLFKFT